jgi:uncharacterized protein (DUF2249 family)
VTCSFSTARGRAAGTRTSGTRSPRDPWSTSTRSPGEQAVAAAVDRLLRMRRGEQVEVQSGTDLAPVWREISDLSPGGYRFTVLQDGPARWRMQVTRRQDDI